MKRAVTLYRGWKMKREFVVLVTTMDRRLLNDAGISQDIVMQRLNTPFWKF